jgi:hypothetical protein
VRVFSYYGSKSKVVHLYPKPEYGKIIEPFAGSARYALRWFDRDVLLVDKYEVIVRVWKYLQQASSSDIMGLPDVETGQSIADMSLTEEERSLIGFNINKGSAQPKLKAQQFNGWYNSKRWIADNLFKIRHWEIRHGTYDEIPNAKATWFIDPPYQFGGQWYVKGNQGITFCDLAAWCQSRHGQVIVCENTKADWLPFNAMREMRGAYSKMTEAIWINRPTPFDFAQTSLFEALAQGANP